MENVEKKALLWGLLYGFILLAACLAHRVFFGGDRTGGKILFVIAQISFLGSALRWSVCYDKKFGKEGFWSIRIPRFVADPHINSLVIHVYKWLLLLPLIGILTL